MDNQLLLIGVVVLLGLLFAFILFYAYPLLMGGRLDQRTQLRSLVQAQRQGEVVTDRRRQKVETLLEAARESRVEKLTDSRLTLEKKLKFAQWNFPPILFHVLEIAISLFAFTVVQVKFNIVMQVLSLLAGPLFMRWLLNLMMDRRFKHFDADYPQFLMSVVGLLKTGMNATGALEAASAGLEDGSLVKQEVDMMLERLRFGVSEDKSIGSFGEDIYHPEIELFVQALLLSRRVGGNLSDTLDRLARQVRKRQYFRKSAVATVSMQRGSIWFIIGILVFMEIYLYFMYPEAVTESLAHPVGWQVWQGALVTILLGIFWIRQVTKIRV